MAENWVFLNGKFSPEHKAFIPVNDRGFLFGEGIFTTIRVHNGRCELLKNHLHRLQQQAEILNFHLSSFEVDWINWINELIQRNQAWEGTWRLKIVVTVKQESGGNCRTVGSLLATLYPYLEDSSKSCKLCLFPHPFDKPLAHVKSLSYLEYLYVRNYANQQGFDDAITQTGEKILLETSNSNLFWIDEEGKCWIPDQQLPYLKGVFLQALIPHLSSPVHFVKSTIDQIPLSASVYICNSLTHIRSVLSIGSLFFPRNQEWEKTLKEATIQALQTDFL